MRPNQTEEGGDLYECFDCGKRFEDPETTMCDDCGGALRNLGRSRDL
jgi:rRNA maturation endonuclease Nob1